MTNPTISIIIPAYNAALSLQRCLDSILIQDFEKFQVIVVNDGSTDSTAEIIESYKSLDKRIQVIHQNNAGVSSARNSALQIAVGEYICFVDSDDFVEREYVSSLFNGITQNAADLAVSGYFERSKYPLNPLPLQGFLLTCSIYIIN